MSLLKALSLVSGLTLLSRILGFVRDAIIVRYFGADATTDAFIIAFRLPNLFRRIFAEGAFTQAFVPVLSEYKTKHSRQATHALIAQAMLLLTAALLCLVLLMWLAAPYVIATIALGFNEDSERYLLAVALSRITFPYILFMSLVALAAAILNTWSKYALSAATPILLNVSFIVAALSAHTLFEQPIYALAWAVFLGGVVQLLVQIPALLRLGLLPPIWRYAKGIWRNEGIRKILRLMAPATIGTSVTQISLLISTAFASTLMVGSVSWLYYADRLLELPAGLLGAALTTVLMPALAKLHSVNQHEQFNRVLDWGLRIYLLIATPAALGLMLLAQPIVTTLFQYGKFSAYDTAQTAPAVMVYGIGVLGMLLVKILAVGYYARQNTKAPVKFALISLACTQLLNLLLIDLLAHVGLALAISLASCINAGLLYYHLRREQIYQPPKDWCKLTIQTVIALTVMGIVFIALRGTLDDWSALTGWQRVGQLSGLMTLGMLTYLGSLYALGLRPSILLERPV